MEDKKVEEDKKSVTTEQIIATAQALCKKFIHKVEHGRARSVETYRECKELLKIIMESDDGTRDATDQPDKSQD